MQPKLVWVLTVYTLPKLVWVLTVYTLLKLIWVLTVYTLLKLVWVLTVYTLLKLVWVLTVYIYWKRANPCLIFNITDPNGVSKSESRSFWTWEGNFGVKMFYCSTNRKTL